MATTTPTDEKPSPDRQAIDPLLDDLTLYHDIGLDTQGRAHFFAPEAREIIVTDTDRRGKGVRKDDVTRTIPLGEKTVDDYCRFVATEADVDWRECSWRPEEAV